MKLYEIVETYSQAMDLELNNTDLETVLDSINLTLKEKAFDIAKVHSNIKSDIDSLKAEEKRLSGRRKSLENGLKRLDDYLLGAMINTDNNEFKNELFTIKLRKSSRVIIDDIDKIDGKYKKQVITVSVDKNLVKKDLKAGSVSGASLETHIGLNIK